MAGVGRTGVLVGIPAVAAGMPGVTVVAGSPTGPADGGTATMGYIGLAEGPPPGLVVRRRRIPRDIAILLALLDDHHNSIEAVAKSLDVTPFAVRLALEQVGLGFLYQQVPAGTRSTVHQRVTNNELAVAFVRDGYSWTTTANRLGHASSNVMLRIALAIRHQQHSMLRYVMEVYRGLVTTTTLSDDHIVAVVQAHGFDMVHAAYFLRMMPETLTNRITAAQLPSPLVALRMDSVVRDQCLAVYWRTVKPATYEDTHIVAVFLIFQPNVAGALAFLGISHQHLITRARSAAPHSLLWLIQGLADPNEKPR